MIRRRPPAPFWIETGLAALSAGLSVLTLVVPAWFERWFGSSPDNGNGDLEWMITIGLAVLAVAMSFLARREWQHAPTHG